MQNLENIVVQALGRDVVTGIVHSVGKNSDDEDVLRISIGYDRTAGPLSVEAMSELIEKVWAASLREGKSAFPVIDFVASDESGDMYAAE